MGQERLQASRALICGCGALGSVAANTLARAGVGKLRIVDRDFLELNNLQRQVLFDENDVAAGIPKAVAAQQRLAQINSQVEVEAVVADVDYRNVLQLFDDVDVVLDGTDNFETRKLINKHCVEERKPLIFGGVSGWEGLVSLFVYKNSACFDCVFTSSETRSSFFDCSSEGVLGVTTSLVGTLMVAETIKLICETGQLLTNKLLICDALNGATEILHTKKSEKCSVCQNAV